MSEDIDTKYRTGGNLEKRRSWSKWSTTHLKEMRLAKYAGLFPKSEGWRNVVEHSLVVNATAIYLARKIEAVGYPIDIDLIDSASILHDVAKRRDVENKKVNRKNETTKGAIHSLLLKDNYDSQTIQAAEYSGRVADIYLSDEEQDEAINNRPIEDLIVAYTDARIRNTNIVSLEEARDKNKLKIPTDADFYDLWFKFYKKVEKKVCQIAKINAADISDESVFELVRQR